MSSESMSLDILLDLLKNELASGDNIENLPYAIKKRFPSVIDKAR